VLTSIGFISQFVNSCFLLFREHGRCLRLLERGLARYLRVRSVSLSFPPLETPRIQEVRNSRGGHGACRGTRKFLCRSCSSSTVDANPCFTRRMCCLKVFTDPILHVASALMFKKLDVLPVHCICLATLYRPVVSGKKT
jgi:hypothetical protein